MVSHVRSVLSLLKLTLQYVNKVQTKAIIEICSLLGNYYGA